MRVIIKKFKTIFWVMTSQDFLRRQSFLFSTSSTNHTTLCPRLYILLTRNIPKKASEHQNNRYKYLQLLLHTSATHLFPWKPLLGGFLQVMLLFNSLRRLITTLRLEVSFFSLLNNLAFFVKGCYYILQRLITF